ncbi:acetyl-CoA C-acetyltransferase [Tepidibacillus decaturensis]|uniref:acetyl-CoA C-acetyltransferase n=1 Tax=Tepidibacillus decaturensis TaxID=1413211 RepID=A0A135L516_9BACI|nr:acetyl-CoA C-acetyltransferase [Tepidibacillus decaturensis]KXG43987.1 acetyl-CoA acetyltransferase [Tepidibacillus decaturensis]
MRKTVIVSGARTPFGKLGGAFKSMSASELGGIAIRGALDRGRVQNDWVDEVIMGMVLQGGAGQIPSRQAARKARLDWDVPTETINKVCASGLRSVTLGDQIIRSGDADTIVAGGMESMSQAPYALKNGRFGMRMGNDELIDIMVHDGLICAFHNVHMAVHGSNVAKEYEISREAQDEWALRSHQLAITAIDNGKLAEEIVPVTIKEKKISLVVDTDESPRRDTSLGKLATLPPVFTQDGSVTAGNAPGINDGAAAMVLMSEEKAQEYGLQPLATILGHTQVAVEAPYLAIAPGQAINKLLIKTGYTIDQIDLIEVNEAFASVVLTSATIVKWNPEKVNVNGGAIALGHPIGASGTRILLTLIYELKRRGGGLGIAAICSGGGQGDAILVQV